MSATHKLHDSHGRRGALCKHPRASRLVTDGMDVTCRRCVALMRLAAIDRAREAVRELSKVDDGPRPAEYGARFLSTRDRALVERSKRGGSERQGPRYKSVRHMVETAAAYWDCGATVKSSSAPNRFEGEPRGTAEGRVSNVERPVDNAIGAVRAIEEAYAGGVLVGGYHYSAPLCRELLVWRHAGEPVYSNAKRKECVMRRPVDTERLVGLAVSISGNPATARHVALIVKRGNEALRAAGERTGEL